MCIRDRFYYTSGKLPSDDDLSFRHAIHTDANLTGKYIESKFKDRIKIIDGNVQQVNVKDREITSIVLKDGQKLTADLFIDATGLSRVLINSLDPKWIDKSRYHPTDRAIPKPVVKDFNFIIHEAEKITIVNFIETSTKLVKELCNSN